MALTKLPDYNSIKKEIMNLSEVLRHSSIHFHSLNPFTNLLREELIYTTLFSEVISYVHTFVTIWFWFWDSLAF
jgi:hypothetical protein